MDSSVETMSTVHCEMHRVLTDPSLWDDFTEKLDHSVKWDYPTILTRMQEYANHPGMVLQYVQDLHDQGAILSWISYLDDNLLTVAPCDMRVLSYLLKHGVPVDSSDAHNKTTLLRVLSSNISGQDIRPIVKLLLDYGADPAAVTDCGLTVWGLLHGKYQIDVAEMLLNASPNPNFEILDRYLRTPVMRAAAVGNWVLVAWLAAHGANVNTVDAHGNT